jgi:uncharacterized repeat protein (TIGR01451 family)
MLPTSLAAVALALAVSPTFAVDIVRTLNQRGPAGFVEGNLGTSSTFTDSIDRGCPSGQELEQVRIELFDLSLQTILQFQNPTSSPDNLEVASEHLSLSLEVNGNSIVGNPIPNTFGPFPCELLPGQDQNQCSPTPLPNPVLETTGPDDTTILTQADGAAFDFFKTGGPIPVTFRAGARVQTDVPGTWQTVNQTPATGNVRITYTCEVPPPPEVVCTSKTLTPSDLGGPDGTVTAQVNISNASAVDVDNVVITDTMDSTMTYAAGTSSIGEPTGGPPTYTFPTQSLAAGSSLGLTYQVDIRGLNPGDQSCNNVQVTLGGREVTGQCRACVGRPDVPLVPAIGWLGLSALLSFFAGLGGLLEYRRRKKIA